MEFILRVQEHTDHEKHLHHKLSFSSLENTDYETGTNTDNIISVTSDLNGFTTLKSVCDVFNWKSERVQIDVNECNENESTLVIQEVSPTLFLIPKSRTEDKIIEFPEFYISELCKVSDYFKSTTVHFTHYSFIDKFPKNEILSMLILLVNPVFVPRIKKFYWEIDSRFVDEMIEIYRYVIENVYRRNKPNPEIVYGKKFKMVYDQGTYGRLEVGRFVEDN